MVTLRITVANEDVNRMDKHSYNPDLTWKNVRTVLRSNRKSRIVLSCKECPEGISPKKKYYFGGICFLCYTLGFLLVNALRVWIIPIEWSIAIKILVSFLALFICSLPLSSILIFLSFSLSEWEPSEASGRGRSGTVL